MEGTCQPAAATRADPHPGVPGIARVTVWTQGVTVRRQKFLEEFEAPFTDVLSASGETAIIESPLFGAARSRSEEHTSELQSLMRISYAVFCLKKKTLKQVHNKFTDQHKLISAHNAQTYQSSISNAGS